MDSISFFWTFFKMFAALAIVIALMLITTYFIKRYFFQSLPEMKADRMINVLSTRHLGPKSSLLLIEVLGQVMLVGLSNQQLSMLSRIDDPHALEKMINDPRTGNPAADADPLSPYRSLLRNLGKLRKDHLP